MNLLAVKRIGWIVILSIFAAACQGNAAGGVAASKPGTLTAVKVDQVSLDGQSPAWQKAPRLEAATTSLAKQPAVPGPTIILQAIYDANSIAIRFEWADATESIYKNAWKWDGTAFSRSGDEDRLMIHFPMTNDAEFSTKGCAGVCHNQDDDPEKWYMAARDSSARYDQWHWKSTRSNPVGLADDKWLGVRADPLDTESGHYADVADTGGEQLNISEQRDGPRFLNSADLASPFILAGQEAPVDVSRLASGAIVPGYILAKITGSRGDLTASGSWADGRWVVVIQRTLNTGHEDDVVFTPPKPLPFGLAITDDGGGYRHDIVETVLVLEWK